MKNLANCTPTEFLKQTNLIRKSVENWIDVTDIVNIRKRMPKNLPQFSEGMSDDEIAKVKSEQKKLMDKQARENLSAILDAMLDAHPDETLEILALCCFVDPKDIDKYPVDSYLTAIMDMIESDSVKRFFSLLVSLGQKRTSIQ